jgi:hypothetical protein
MVPVYGAGLFEGGFFRDVGDGVDFWPKSEGRGVSWWERVNNGACYEIMIAICKIWHKTKVLNCL